MEGTGPVTEKFRGVTLSLAEVMAEETFHKGRGKTVSALGGVNIKVTLVKLGLWARRGGLSNWGCNKYIDCALDVGCRSKPS